LGLQRGGRGDEARPALGETQRRRDAEAQRALEGFHDAPATGDDDTMG